MAWIHKRKVHNCINVCPNLYECKIENAAKLPEEKACKCMFCPKRFCKETMEDHYWKKHKENFTWIKCELGCCGRLEKMFKDHIKWNNIYSKNEY